MKNDGARNLQNHPVVSHDAWLAARKDLLRKEKELTRKRDEVTELRGSLPWERVTKKYAFDGAKGEEALEDLFEGRSQLVVYHAMFDPKKAGPDTSWTEDAACFGCSFWADNFDGIVVYLNHRDVTLIAVSRATFPKIDAYQRRMGWTFTAQDPALSERDGVSVFYKDSSGQVFHTYSTYARGLDLLNAAYNYLDIVPKGRDEGDRGPYWVRRRDEYEASTACDDCDRTK